MTDLLLEAKGLRKSYVKQSDKVAVLDGANLTVRAGETVALTGASGCGKTTMLYILGLLDRADGGELYFEGKPCHTLSERKRTEIRRQSLGFVYQFHGLLADFTAFENVLMPFLVQGGATAEERGRAEALMEKLGVAHRKDHAASELSGGEQQRVAVARALAKRPRLLLADEPTGNLDEKNAADVMEAIFGFCAEHDAALVCVTHHPELARQCGSRYVLEGGKAVAG
jgi:lipoprotein-releasing system ATP-binding protein